MLLAIMQTVDKVITAALALVVGVLLAEHVYRDRETTPGLVCRQCGERHSIAEVTDPAVTCRCARTRA